MRTLRKISIAFYSLTGVLLVGCKSFNHPQDIVYSSLQEAQLACQVWRDNGGTWELKINDFQVSDTSSAKKQHQLPIKVENNNNTMNEDPAYLTEGDDPTVYLPILPFGHKKRDITQESEITYLGDDKWVKYDRRACSLSENSEDTVLGMEYEIMANARVDDSEIPLLKIIKSFAFSN